MEQTGGFLRANPASDEARFDLRFFKRFWRICGILFPSFNSPSVWLTIFLVLLCLLEQVVIYYVGLVPSKYSKIFLDKDKSQFFKHTLYAVGLILAEVFILSTKTYVGSVLYITWRGNLCRVLHDIYFKDILYYQLNVVDKSIDNPDQRMTQDVDRMCNTFSQVLVPIAILPFTTGYYILKCWGVTSYLGPVSNLIFFTVFTVFNKLLMSPVVKHFYKQEQREGDFRYNHMQIRMNSESAAFYRSGAVEKEKANKKLHNLLATQGKLIRREYALNFCVNAADYLGSILSYVAIAVPIFAGRYDHLSPGDLAMLIGQNGFYSIYLINCFTKLIDQSIQMTDVVGTAHRIGQLFEVLGRLNDEQSEDYRFLFGSDERPRTQPLQPNGRTVAFSVNDVTYGLPKSSRLLCKNLSFQLTSGTSVLVTGDSGCGKTSLLRVLSGLWPHASGNVNKNMELGPSGLLYLPQKPYFTDGTLREQVIYPLQDSEVVPDDEKIIHFLKLVGLERLLDRLGGIDAQTDWNWYDEMSPGEMQRLSFVRLFFHNPPFAILDEATSQVSEELEQLLYETCLQLGITVMSVGHRSTVRTYHSMELHLEKTGSWSLTPITSSVQ
ncbi:hypothetical protein RRG08_001993 [Elysia crispata]|uniref:ATP-binding cassette sub-family D member 4 n=1 Tax=Elysia crispata TaxID=231223 RepID=A0AAE1BCD2_9GAST|nr:hypothetical protein RRG08_001993 [Elysia crispata]